MAASATRGPADCGGGIVPTYQYACTECGHRLEAVQSFSDDPLSVCPVCGGRLRKVFSPVGIVFKGSGFYRTDSRAKDKAAVGADTAPADGSGKKDSGGQDAAAATSGGKSDGSAGSGKAGSGSSGSESSGSESSGSGSSGSGSSGPGSGRGKSSAADSKVA
jgi:putative FmdB family regulatory protein